MILIFSLITAVLYIALFFGLHQSWLAALWLATGFLIGFGLLVADEAVGYRWYSRDGVKVLITRSAMFLLAYSMLAIYVITSSGSWLGSGIVLGIGLQLWWEMARTYRQPDVFKARFLSQLKRPFSPADLTRLVIAGALFWLILAAMLLW